MTCNILLDFQDSGNSLEQLWTAYDFADSYDRGRSKKQLLFIIYIQARFHFYVDDTVVYTSAPTLDLSLICKLLLTLKFSQICSNSDKTKPMLFSCYP